MRLNVELNDRCSAKEWVEVTQLLFYCFKRELIYYLMCLPILRGLLCFGLIRISDSYLKNKAIIEVGQLSTEEWE